MNPLVIDEQVWWALVQPYLCGDDHPSYLLSIVGLSR
jgi:hypothetical protein